MIVTKNKKCPACGGAMHAEQVHNSLSRYCKAYICNACGTKEAFEGFFWRPNAIAAGLITLDKNA